MRIHYLLVLIIIVSFYNAPVASNSLEKKPLITKEIWNSESGKYDYNENYKTRKTKNNIQKNKNFKNPFAFNMPGNLAKFLIWGIVLSILIVVFILLIKRIIKNSDEKLKPRELKITDTIENIDETDLESLLRYSENEKLYRDALRFKYLLLLRLLNQLKLIIWKKDKTNGIYLSEMRVNSGYDLFSKITIAFERTWYGNKEFEEKDYQRMVPQFELIQGVISESVINKTNK